jgi:hypothetical protein
MSISLCEARCRAMFLEGVICSKIADDLCMGQWLELLSQYRNMGIPSTETTLGR